MIKEIMGLLGFFRGNGKENGNDRGYRGYVGLPWDNFWVMEKRMDTTTWFRV